MLGSAFPTNDLLRRRIFLEAPLTVFRTLTADVERARQHPSVVSQFKSFPLKGETVVAMEVRGKQATVASLDGLVFTVQTDALAAFEASAASLPEQTRRKPSTQTGNMNIYAARALAKAGVAPAQKWVADYEAHEKCYRKQWDKLDPGGQAHHYILVSTSGATRDLDAVVDSKVRKACKSAASEKRRTRLLGQIAKAQGKLFSITSKEALERFSGGAK